MIQLLHGNALAVLPKLTPSTYDAVITDPPYASGGKSLAERQQATSKKYTNTKNHSPFPDFEGDAMDQRSWTRLMTEALAFCRTAAKPGAILAMFIDWRQYAALTDALQWAGWLFRGAAVWDKVSSRPQRGRFRQQAEFILWASNGHLSANRSVPCLPGVYTMPNVNNIGTEVRYHTTQKPLALMRQIVKITVPGGHILDPFCGSGSTLEAAALEGYSATGIEVSLPIIRTAAERLDVDI